MASETGKKAKHDDRISNLSDSILSHVLSSLPIKDAVSTSILSTRWRHLYAYMVSLDVDFHLFRRSPPHIVTSFTNFMDKMLFVQTEGRIEQFRLDHINMLGINDSHVCGWISAALWRGLKEIDLVFAPKSSIIPMLLFTSKTLVTLKLEFPFLMTVPVHVNLPSLKTLELKLIKFEDDGSVKRLLSSCPVLEDLSISGCDMQNMKCLKISNPTLKSLTLVFNCNLLEFQLFFFKLAIVIDLPSLVYLKYEGFRAKSYSVGNMPCLVRADINFSGKEIIYHRHGLVELFEGLGNVKSLRLTINPKALPILSHKRFVALQNLLHLEILDRMNKWKGAGLSEFLEFLPNLQTLVTCKVSNEVWFPMEEVPSCVVYQLKECKVLDFDDESSLFKLATYILKNATVLDKLTICTSRILKVDAKFKITKQLLNLPRCSNKCQVVAF
ncbi:hypothetical protein V6N13_141666 [Hibiscus sabdariffa]|uniref:Uncharacterized protein n=2 Tax=Hibiscus sabdariffa TaxID=183260 RepID=A0ABR2AVH2_9ROSI